MLYSLPLSMFGAVLMWAYTETAEGAAIGFAVLSVDGLIVVVTTRLWGGARPRREAANLDDIYLMRAELLTEEHPMLHFEVSTGRCPRPMCALPCRPAARPRPRRWPSATRASSGCRLDRSQRRPGIFSSSGARPAASAAWDQAGGDRDSP